MKQYKTQVGKSYPPGATVSETGVNFSIFSRNATGVQLLIYETAESKVPIQVITLDPEVNRTFFFWHIQIVGLRPVVFYTWRVDGPDDTETTGYRFNPRYQLLDPWAHAVTDNLWDRARSCDPDETNPPSMRAVVLDDKDYDWEGDKPLNRPMEQSIIYEMHVGGFTRHSSAQSTAPGTFAGIIEKIPYLHSLGVTEVELLPVMAFDCQDVPPGASERGLVNYWGYSTHSFFSPHPGYCVAPEQGEHRRQFRDMVKALHKAGIGVIIDVVFNHTSESGVGGPVINFKGTFNEGFYHLEPDNKAHYRDYTGCGNTVNCNHPLVAAYIIECLEYWVKEMHVDGFRFDLASVLARGEDGEPMYHAPVLWNIEFSTVLSQSALIAEAWDAAGLYQVGGFPGFRWAEWNGMYRDVIRRFVKGDPGLIAEVATRVTGSSDLYESGGRLPINSINFITCHDGFTLQDLVSFNEKHNEANGEEGRDGANDNNSWNCGYEGFVDDPAVNELRYRQVRNFMTILLVSHGVPMLLSGDEMLRSQRGNNNSYCQDNELGWLDWGLLEQNGAMFHFVKNMIALRKRHKLLQRKRYLTGGAVNARLMPDIAWHGTVLNEPLWKDKNARFLAYTMAGVEAGEEDLHVIFNMSENVVEAQLPQLMGQSWFRTVDTSYDSPEDILLPEEQPLVQLKTYTVQPRSVVILEGRIKARLNTDA